MDSDQGKLFIGGISWETTEDKLKDYFSNYGEVLQTVVMRDKVSGRPRGFGFVVFADPSVLDAVLEETHILDGRTVEAKRALSREEQHTSKASNLNPNRNFGGGGGGGGNTRTKKIFIGGLPPTLTEDGFRQYFEAFGNVTDVVVMYDQQTNRPRGFGFITFDSEDAVDRVLVNTFHDLSGKQVEVKRALPKDSNPGGGGRSGGGNAGGGSGVNYQGYGNSGGNSSSYDSRMDSNRYIPSQHTGGGFPPYGSSGYNAPGYGYGPGGNGMGYGSYGNYGGSNPGYGVPAGAAYGNPSVPNASYGNGPPGAPRSSWNSQASSGYGNMNYGNAPWGGSNAGGGGSGSGGPVSGPTGQSPSGSAGYGNQGFGYGGYGGGDGPYGHAGAYGAVGGRGGSGPNGNASGIGEPNNGGYMGGSYGETTGYGNPGWRSDPVQSSGYGAPANGPYGGQVGYGGAPIREAQQQ